MREKEISVLLSATQQVISEEILLEKIKKKKKLRVKFGADPSAPDLHFGHLVILKKLRDFQDLGHEVDFVIGDFTGMIGDPSGRSKTRPILTKQMVEKNARTYEEQVFKILDKTKTRVVFNSKWHGEMSFEKALSLTSVVTLARIIEREDFMKRYKEGTPISITELLYPIIQAYDSVVLQSDVEVGGTDQTFNLLLGRELQKEFKQSRQVVMTLPILPGVDGKMKMSKSLDNSISLQDVPREMFGKIMSIPDHLIMTYFRLLTTLDKKSLDEMEKAMSDGENPKTFKEKLAHQLVQMFHSASAADEAATEFAEIFKSRGTPNEMEEIFFDQDQLDVIELVESSKKFSSRGEIRRLINGGGVYYDGKQIKKDQKKIAMIDGAVLKLGKRIFFRTKKRS